MKTVKVIKKLAFPVLIGGLGGLLSLGISASAWAAGSCVQDEPGAQPVTTSGGAASCDVFNGQLFGCRVRFGETGNGRCRVRDANGNVLFTAVADSNAENGMSWTIIDPTDPTPLAAKVNAVILKSTAVEDGNACRYIYPDEATSGSGQGWFEDSFAATTEAWFCTDGKTDDTPARPCKQAACESLDLGGEETFVGLFKPDNPNFKPDQCTCFANKPWTACNEEATVDEGDNKCTGDGINKALPVVFEGINDGTTVCRTIGGERKCWSR